ncbi:hypothetical protein I7I51_03283 [Histoplasma capsulatum]|uniref:Uncharacterized protein n=1 Tax=Ajellomyces capsulatus TaxID=5037 RepID=A0A8A1M538_AJECA|nr:hypothetical protein I7I51_03283 [Histoplasma capsulatum]
MIWRSSREKCTGLSLPYGDAGDWLNEDQCDEKIRLIDRQSKRLKFLALIKTFERILRNFASVRYAAASWGVVLINAEKKVCVVLLMVKVKRSVEFGHQGRVFWCALRFNWTTRGPSQPFEGGWRKQTFERMFPFSLMYGIRIERKTPAHGS